ncbi:MAG: hypothetical protein IJQ56_05860, partial [Synergistaceae bacterium]|nr:hypothetical protein [Synergistaceae bacterium]
ISFGHALAGYGRTLFALPMNVNYVAFGLAGGLAFGLFALWLYYRHRKEFYIDEDEQESDSDNRTL